ncbi:MAG: metal-sensing transcriptional repressor [Xanthobacteraceae bacterium]|nr:metal-sensing transcriptional repressor [Xanthobacteraceae bacterium]
MSHHKHPDVIKRLKRADGHLQTIIEMIGEGGPYPQLAQQLEAVERAIENAKKALIHEHIDQCLDRAVAEPGAKSRAAVRQLKLVARYL